jgi:hypothetical protein
MFLMRLKMDSPQERARKQKRLREEQNRRVLREIGQKVPLPSPSPLPPNAQTADVIPINRKSEERERT